jgi:hypothetical protein
MRPPDKDRDGPATTTKPPQRVPPASVTEEILPESSDRRARRQTRELLANEHRRVRHARLADQVMPLAAYYATRWPRSAV